MISRRDLIKSGALALLPINKKESKTKIHEFGHIPPYHKFEDPFPGFLIFRYDKEFHRNSIYEIRSPTPYYQIVEFPAELTIELKINDRIYMWNGFNGEKQLKSLKEFLFTKNKEPNYFAIHSDTREFKEWRGISSRSAIKLLCLKYCAIHAPKIKGIKFNMTRVEVVMP